MRPSRETFYRRLPSMENVGMMMRKWMEKRFQQILDRAPQRFRDEYAAEMKAVFSERLGREVTLLGRWRCGWRELRALRTVVRDLAKEEGTRKHRSLDASLARDLRIGLRVLVRNPTYAVVAIATLGLGIGATTIVFTVVRDVVLQPLPYQQPEELVRIYTAIPDRGVERGAFSLPNFEDIEAQTSGASSMAAFWVGRRVLLSDGGAQELQVGVVTPDFFRTLGVQPILGATLSREDERRDNRSIVLGHHVWTETFGADSTVVGSTVDLDHEAYRVAGIMPPGFDYPYDQADAWTYVSTVDQASIPTQLRQVTFLSALARLKPGVTSSSLEAELAGVLRGLEETYPDINRGKNGAAVVPLRDVVLGDVDQALWMLLGAVVFLLLIACVNVASLQVVRGSSRKSEFAVRTSLGASRSRLLTQLITESLLLALCGGLAGVLLAWVGIDLLAFWAGDLLPRADEIALSGSVLFFAMGATIASVLLFGLTPALLATEENPAIALRGGRGSLRGGSFLQRALVTAEVSLAMALLVGATLLGRSLIELQNVDLGFDPENALAVTYTLSTAEHPTREEWMGVYRDFLEHASSLPGVVAAGTIRALPLTGIGETVPVRIPGSLDPEPGAEPNLPIQFISPGALEALGIPLISGRAIEAQDRRGSPPVIVVSAAFVDEYLDGEPIGQIVQLGPIESTIVGVAGNVRQRNLRDDPEPIVYVSQEHVSRVIMSMVLRTSGDPLQLAGPVREIMAGLNPNQPITRIEPLTSVVGTSLGQPRFFTLLLALFSASALMLAAIGVYGVVAYGVTQRRSEIQLRMALGATGTRVTSRSVRIGMVPAALGIGVGLILAAMLSRSLSSLVFGVPETDPTTYAAVALVLLLAALIAAYIPARRASREDPARILG